MLARVRLVLNIRVLSHVFVGLPIEVRPTTINGATATSEVRFTFSLKSPCYPVLLFMRVRELYLEKRITACFSNLVDRINHHPNTVKYGRMAYAVTDTYVIW